MRILKPTLIVIVAVVALWLLSGVIGFSMALGTSLLLSIALTVGLNLVLGAWRKRS